MGDQLMELIKIFHKVELEGGQATLSATTHEGKTKLKLEIVSPSSATVLPSSPPAPGRRRRHRGARARARRNQRAAAHQAEAAASAPLAPPLRFLPSPPPDSGRRQVLSCVERLPSFSDLDGAPPSSPSPPPAPAPPPPLPPRGVSPLKVQQRVEPCNTSGVVTASPQFTIVCYQCEEEVKCDNDPESSILWCPRCWSMLVPVMHSQP